MCFNMYQQYVPGGTAKSNLRDQACQTGHIRVFPWLKEAPVTDCHQFGQDLFVQTKIGEDRWRLQGPGRGIGFPIFHVCLTLGTRRSHASCLTVP